MPTFNGVSSGAPFPTGGDFMHHIPKDISSLEGGSATGIVANDTGEFNFQAPSSKVQILVIGANPTDYLEISADGSPYVPIPASQNAGWVVLGIRTSKILWRAPAADSATSIWVICSRGEPL